MADEQFPHAAETRPDGLGPMSEERPSVEGPAAGGIPEGPPESRTKGMLREAIQKVMGEIEYHEREAKNHLQLAEELRKDLRESFAFLLTQEGGVAPGESSEEAPPAELVAPSPPEPVKPAAEKRPRAGKKRGGRKPKGG
jgi:hypothetical protein